MVTELEFPAIAALHSYSIQLKFLHLLNSSQLRLKKPVIIYLLA